ncbi:MAG: hypothetical protein WC373_14220 [Smithella sp.]|jgi:hypothetical protein
MGLLTQAIAGGMQGMAQGAANSFDFAMKATLMKQMEDAKALREEHLLELKGKQDITKITAEQGLIADREKAHAGAAVVGVDADGQYVTADAYNKMAPEDRPDVTNMDAYKASLSKDKQAYIGLNQNGLAVTQEQVERNAAEADSDPNVKRYVITPWKQTEVENQGKALTIAEQNANSNLKKAEAYEKLSRAKADNVGTGKPETPLTAKQKLDERIKASTLLKNFKADAAGGQIDPGDLETVNAIYREIGDPEIVGSKGIIPGKKGILPFGLSDDKDKEKWTYGTGLISSATPPNAKNSNSAPYNFKGAQAGKVEEFIKEHRTELSNVGVNGNGDAVMTYKNKKVFIIPK